MALLQESLQNLVLTFFVNPSSALQFNDPAYLALYGSSVWAGVINARWCRNKLLSVQRHGRVELFKPGLDRNEIWKWIAKLKDSQRDTMVLFNHGPSRSRLHRLKMVLFGFVTFAIQKKNQTTT